MCKPEKQHNSEQGNSSSEQSELNKTWSELEQEKIAARLKLNLLPPEEAQERANVLRAELWQPNFENHNPPGSFWDFDECEDEEELGD